MVNQQSTREQEPLNCTSSELCTYLQALAAGFLPTLSSDTSAYVRSKSIPIASKSYQRGKKTIAFPGFPSLMMCSNLTETRGEELLTLFLEAFPARTYQQQEREQELTEKSQVCGNTWHELSEKYDRLTHSWKIHHSLFPEERHWSSVTLPKWGMTVSGQLYQHPTLVRPINATGSGLWLTPSANEDAAGTPNGKMQKMLGNDPRIRGTTKEEWATGTLNPTWVEWLMGWPLGWTDLERLEMDRFQQWQQQHLTY